VKTQRLKADVANDPQKVAAFVDCFRSVPVSELISNLQTDLQGVQIGDAAFPISVNSRGLEGNCYICDPVTGYVDYAKDELRNFAASPMLQSCLHGVVNMASSIVRATRLQDIVFLNNWLLSTNPVPLISRELAEEIKIRMITRFPTHAVAIRSLNTIADQSSIDALRDVGFRMLPARQVYVYSGGVKDLSPSKSMVRDTKLLKRCELAYVNTEQFTEHDYRRAAQLYSMLYLEKYTPLNPQYTARYIKEMHSRGLIELVGFRDDTGELMAVTGLFANGNTLTQPIVGYDTMRPLKEGLYRLVMAVAQQRAISHGLFFNMSAGAAQFKRLRRAVPCIEYTAIFDQHLPNRQRYAIKALTGLLTKVGVPLLERFEL
jgi:hypothetical protein